MGTQCGQAICADLQDSPDNCGSCGNTCADAQYCTGSACSCRPGLNSCGGNCRDLAHDFNNCGSCGNNCGNKGLQNPKCVGGVCLSTSCGALGLQGCNGACFSAANFASSPLNCGGCGNACAFDEVCVQGNCQPFFTSASCNTCPCPACGASTTCCTYPGGASEICVQGNACP